MGRLNIGLIIISGIFFTCFKQFLYKCGVGLRNLKIVPVVDSKESPEIAQFYSSGWMAVCGAKNNNDWADRSRLIIRSLDQLCSVLTIIKIYFLRSSMFLDLINRYK